MPKLRLYIETSVWSHYYAEDAPERRDQTREFLEWCAATKERVVLFASAYVLEEIRRADRRKRRKLDALLGEFLPTMLEPTDEVRRLAEAYHNQGAIPPAKTLDALHVATATANDVDALVSWNYRHLVNLWRETKINAVNAVSGYRKPLRIVTPPEVMEDEVQ